MERDLRIIFVAADEKRKEKNLKYVILFYSVRVFKVSTTVSRFQASSMKYSSKNLLIKLNLQNITKKFEPILKL